MHLYLSLCCHPETEPSWLPAHYSGCSVQTAKAMLINISMNDMQQSSLDDQSVYFVVICHAA